ncbi:hypothetical protein I6E74_09885 [Salinibacterium sp. SWN139]|uniref:hypothetical protein n=1 Tax=Salinibacterium sp. SWN139 TaxID=2792055 RepID=UPI0018CF78BB|nr:hypothetical protein [Salinibacterium sp. SWN139]MBH0054474.1 hypothetical protein [Salinibacterium sp. SWN139]
MSIATAAVKVAHLSRTKGAAHEQTLSARAELAAVHIKRIMDDAPPLSEEQLDRIVGILKTGGQR